MILRKELVNTILVGVFFCLQSFGSQISETFSSDDKKASGDLYWNTEESRLQPPFQIRNFDDGQVVGNQSLNIDMGNGSDGPFDSSTYWVFDSDHSVVGNVIEIDTDAHQVLQFTSFNLEAGFTIKPIGSHALVIRVMGVLQVAGVIDCSGDDGNDLTTNATLINSGGGARCGGGFGGKGGSSTQSATSGVSGGLNTTGGTAGPSTSLSNGQGGGGGGGYNEPLFGRDPEDGTDNAAAIAGVAGSIFLDRSITVVGGGSGGGGGSSYLQSTANDSNGGGGGGGGGVIMIYAGGDAQISGSILADGGDGGADSGTLLAGGGGGGGGGTILLFSGGLITLSGSVSALAGSAGVTSNAAAGDGGKGAEGRTWLTDFDSLSDCGCETPQGFLTFFGRILPRLGAFTMTTKVFDTQSTHPSVTDLSLVTTGGASISAADVKLAASESADFSGLSFKSLSQLGTESERYFKLQISVDNQSLADPIYVDTASIKYDPYVESDFRFSGGCGLVKLINKNQTTTYVQNSRGRNIILFVWILLLMPLITMSALRINWRNSNRIFLCFPNRFENRLSSPPQVDNRPK